MYIPTELLQKILREATVVPEAFDTSFDTVLHENREAVLKAIHTSMFTKTALSLVSKLFCELVYEFLYEIVSIHRFKYIPFLSRLLQEPATYSGRTSTRPRGSLCRRLEIYLGMGSENYKDIAWYEGGHTLWGLIAACPNINTLLCRVWAKDGTVPYLLSHATCPHLTHPSLWKLIASTCGPQLRRMELFGFSIRMDRVEMMLRYCTNLEVCRLVHVRPYSDEEEIYDGEEPTFLETTWVRSSWIEMDETNGQPSGLFDASARREFAEAKDNVSWPSCSLRAPYALPSLHTFHIDQFNSRVTQLNMPKLRYLGLFASRTWSETVKEDILASYLSFPISLTHLSFGGNALPLEAILNAFPYIKELCFHYRYDGSSQWSTVKILHPFLGVIKYVCHASSENMVHHVGDLLSVVQSGMLPALREVSILRWEKKGRRDEELPFEQFQKLGVGLEVEFVQPFGRYTVEGKLCDPDYTFHQ